MYCQVHYEFEKPSNRYTHIDMKQLKKAKQISLNSSYEVFRIIHG